jgi:hypothetical protein
MPRYRGGLGRTRRGSRVSGWKENYETELRGPRGGSAWDYASEMLNRGVDSVAGGLAHLEAQRRAREERERKKTAELAAQARLEKIEADNAALNAAVAAQAVESPQTAYVGPEGPVVPRDPTFGGTVDPTTLEGIEAGGRVPTGPEATQILEQKAEIDMEAAAQRIELEEKAQDEMTEVERDNAQMAAATHRTRMSYEKARAARDDRMRNHQESVAQKQAGQDISQQIALTRQADKAEAAVDRLEAKYDDLKLYTTMKTTVKKEWDLAGKRAKYRSEKDELDREVRNRMISEKLTSGLFKADPETADLVFDRERALAAAMEASPPPPVKPGASWTSEDYAKANEIRYTMPHEMLNWKAGMWEAQGLSPAEAMEMAAVGARQAARQSRQTTTRAASGREVAVDPRASLSGISASQGYSGGPAEIAPDPREKEEDDLVSAIETSVVQRDEEQSEGGPEAAPPSAPLPAPAATPDAAPAPAPPQAPAPEPPAPSEGPQGIREWILSGRDVKELAAQSDLEKQLEDTLSEKATAALTDPETMQPSPYKTLAMQGKKKELKRRADEQLRVTQHMLDTAKRTDMAPKEQADAIARDQHNLNIKEYGQEIGNVIKKVTDQMKSDIEAGKDPAEAESWAKGRIAELAKVRAQKARGEALDERAASTAATWEYLSEELTTVEGLAKFGLTTGIPMAVATVTGMGGVGLVGRLALTAFATGGVDLAMSGGVLDENGNVDWDQIYSSGVQGVTGATEVPAVGGMLRIAKNAAGKGLLGKVAGFAASGLVEGTEEAFQETIANLWEKGEVPDGPTLLLSAALGGTIGAGFGLAVPGADGKVSKKEKNRAAKELQDALDIIKAESPDLFDADLLEAMPEEELKARIEQLVPEIQAGLAGNIPAAPRLAPAAEVETAVEPVVEETVQPEPAPAPEPKQAIEEAKAEVHQLPAAKDLTEAVVGQKVEAPAELAEILPKNEWRKIDDKTTETVVEGQRLRVQADAEGLTLTAGQAGATYGTAEPIEAAGVFKPGKKLTVKRPDLIQLAAGTGRRVAGHEVMHFFRENGLVAKRDWNTLAVRYNTQARAIAADYGHADWGKLTRDQKDTFVEEAVSDAFGEYARSRFGEGKASRVPKPLRNIYNTIRALGMKVTGKSQAEFEKLLKGEFAKGEDKAIRDADVLASPVRPEQVTVPTRGWSGQANPRTGTIGLRGPAGEKIGAKMDGTTLAVKTIGKGLAKTSQGVVQAIRDFAQARGAKRIIMSSSQAELTPAAVKWRTNMEARGEARYVDGTFEILPATAEPLVRAQKVAIDAKGRIIDPVAQKRNLNYFLATEARRKGRKAKGGAATVPPPKTTPKTVAGAKVGRVSNQQWLDRTEEALGGIGSKEWDASMGWYRDLRGEFVKEFGKDADKMLVLWGVSQQRASASKGLADVFTAEDIAKGFRTEKKAGLASDRLVALAKGGAGTLGQKLADFVDSVHQRTTRSWVGNDPRGGQPAAFDVWAMRDLGYIDETTQKWAKKNGVDLEVDAEGAPTDPQYHWGVTRYNDIAAYLNKQKVQGRTDWKAYEAQALGWMAIQKVMGARTGTGGPETVSHVFAKNKAQVAAEARPGASIDPAAQKRFDALPKDAQARVTIAAVKKIAPLIAKATGARVQDIRPSEGKYEGDVTPNAVLEILGSPDQIQGFTDVMAQVMGQDEVWAIKPAGAKSNQNAILIDVTDAQPFTPETASDTYGQIFGDQGGYTLTPDGALRVLVPFTNPTPARLATQESDLSDRLRMFGSDTMNADIGGAEVVIGKGVQDEGPSPRRVDGVEGVGDLSQSYSEAYDSAIEAEGEPRARAARQEVAPGRDTVRKFSGPILNRLREIKSHDGRPVGSMVAEQVSDRQEFVERKLSRLRYGYRKAVDAFRRAEGKQADESWDQVVEALDGKASYKSLTPTQQKMYSVTRAIFNTVKHDAIEAGTWTGQAIHNYFPHMRLDASESDPIADHLAGLQQNPKKLAALRQTDTEWLSGVIGEATDYELAAKDMQRNWKSEKWWKQNPHLEKHRGENEAPFRRDQDVLLDYLDSAYPRIGTARYFGKKAEVINEAMAAVSEGDRNYMHQALQETLGVKPKGSGLLGGMVERAAREVQTLAGLSKLATAWVPQLTQMAVAHSEASAPGTIQGISSALKGTAALFQYGYANAERAGSTFAADTQGGSEIMKAQYGAGTGTTVERMFTNLFSLGGLVPAGKKIVSSTYGVVTLDKAARVWADAVGREHYMAALRKGDEDILLDLLGKPELVKKALREDAPRVDDLERMYRSGLADKTVLRRKMAFPSEGTPKYAGKQLGLQEGMEMMDRAAKRFTDKTQYRTRAQDAPLAFNHPGVKWSNTFLSFMYQHWRWQATHMKGVKDNVRKNPKLARRHARVLMTQNLVMAPLMGQVALTARALMAGRGMEEEDEYQTPGEAFDAVMGLDPIAAPDKLGIALRYLQGWQFAGGIGYPATIVERWRRAAKRKDKYRGLVTAVGGAPTESVVDAGVAATTLWDYAGKWSDGTATNADMRKVKRALWTMTSHIAPNPFGLGGGVRREMGSTENYPNTSPGWLGYLWDPEAEWTAKEGVTSDTYREREADRKMEKEDRELSARERAEAEREESRAQRVR